jgi:transketolase
MDAIQKANSGHPGAPMGMADMAEVLWNDFIEHNPANPDWPDRDRCVFSNGHGSMLIYALLHLQGFDLDIEEIKNFRQLHSKTPGHPEYGVTPGVENTSGPLGQGIAMATGMALAERMLAEQFNRPGFEVVDHYTYVFMGDGCMMEGISHECCSLAGALGLGKLIALYDDNDISIDGRVEGWFTDDTPGRFEAYGWHVVPNIDGHDPEAVAKAIEEARSVTDRPSLICCKTLIGKGAPNVCGSEKCHGSPLGEEEVAAARKEMNWPNEPFHVPKEIYEAWDGRDKGARLEAEWKEKFEAYRKEFPALAAEFERRIRGELPSGFDEAAEGFIAQLQSQAEAMATRKASGKSIEGYAPMLPEMVGGSADLTGSNKTMWSGSKAVTPGGFGGNYIYYGVREFAMAAMMNGMALHGGIIPYGGTFHVFSDYSRHALRMAALMGIRVLHVLTHDSIGVGEDGPTHQPVEHTASLRLIPKMHVWRPCDTAETAAAWKRALMREDGPACLVLTRQSLPHQERDSGQLADIAKGGYVLKDFGGPPELIIIATGSEVAPAVQAAERLSAGGRGVRVVSMPCVEAFEEQDRAYRDAVLPPEVTARVAVEAGVPDMWYKYVGRDGRVVGMSGFGESAPGKVLFEYFGFTADKVAEAAERAMGAAG